MERGYFEILRKTDQLSEKIVSCKDCTKCCENGVVYLLPEERNHLASLGVPIIRIESVEMIKRNNDGSCPMLDKENKKCTIYNNRPYCCRAFPIDIFSRNNVLEWGIYTYCPNDRIDSNIIQKDNSINHGILRTMIARYEQFLSKDDIDFFNNEDKICAKCEILDCLKDEYEIISTLGSSSTDI